MGIANPVQTRIDYGVEIEGLVPLYIEREAARFALYNWSSWIDLDAMERAACVAHYRLNAMVNMHTEDAIARAMKKLNPPPNRIGG